MSFQLPTFFTESIASFESSLITGFWFVVIAWVLLLAFIFASCCCISCWFALVAAVGGPASGIASHEQRTAYHEQKEGKDSKIQKTT